MKRKLFILTTMVAALLFMGCQDNNNPTVKGNGKPAQIDYIRTPHPETADSAIVEAEKLQTIVIVGSNLQAVNQILFDDIEASLNPAYITEKTILLTVPFSEKRTKLLSLFTSDNLRTDYDFTTFIPAPKLNSLKCEYVPDGDIAQIRGSYFYEPLTVWFRTGANGADSIEAEITVFDGNNISVVVPTGAEEGTLTVQSKYGQSVSKFRFRDHTGLITDCNIEFNANGKRWGNPWEIGLWDDAEACDGGYMLFKREQVGEWFWSQEDLAGCYWDCYDAIKTPYLPAGDDLTLYGLRFEANVKTWTDLPMHIWFASGKEEFGMGNDGATDTPQAHWCPWLVAGDATSGEWTVQEYKTDGWETFTIPLTEFKYDKLGRFSTDGQTGLLMGDMSKYMNLNFMIFGMQCDKNSKHDIELYLDNPRLVKL